jgi:hypothetical protein
MNVNSISSAPSTAQPGSSSSAQAGPRALWFQVGSNLKSGNLAGAQQAFASLKSLYKANHPGALSSGGPLASDVASLGKALASGSLSAAQSAFSTLEQAAKAAGIGGNSGSSSGAGAAPSTTNEVDVLA